MSNIQLLGLSGSNRIGSFNRALLENAKGLLGPGTSLEIFEGLDQLPFYSEDLDGEHLDLKAKKLRDSLKQADGVLIASPEHNFSVSAILKNALDWASRPYGIHSFVEKPTAIVGASGGLFGTMRAQLHTREVLHALQADVVARPEVLVTQATTKFDSDGRLTDATTLALLNQLLENLTRKIETRRSYQRLQIRAS